MGNWIKLEEQRPPTETPLLIYFPPRKNVLGNGIEGKQAVAYLSTLSNPSIWFSAFDDEFLGYEDDITYWRPQLDPPEKEENNGCEKY